MPRDYSTTPDGRYFVHNGRLWRCTNPHLTESIRQRWVASLMKARRAVRSAKNSGCQEDLLQARADVDTAKRALGERGPTWWGDEVDYNCYLVHNTPYADWFRNLRETSE